MSEDLVCCDYCGYYSTSREVCTHCGHDTPETAIDPHGSIYLADGKLTVRPNDHARAPEAWKELAELWERLERETSLKFWPSQMDKFPPTGEVLELYGSTLDVLEIKQNLPGMFIIEFQELPGDQIPKYSRHPQPERRRKKR